MSKNAAYAAWSLGTFERPDNVNPIFSPGDATFDCPLLGRVKWESLGIFNPATIVRDGKVYCLYRAAGQALFDTHDPTALIGRTSRPFLYPQHRFEIEGPIPNVCFANGLICFNGRWLLYYGAGDKHAGVCATKD